jgi:hypothetical protein
VPARERDLECRPRLAVIADNAALRCADRIQTLHQQMRKPRVERRLARLGDNEPAPAIGGDVSPFRDAHCDSRALPAELLAKQSEQIERILPDHRRNAGRGHRQQFSCRGKRARHPIRREACQRSIECVALQQQELMAGQPFPVPVRPCSSRVHPFDLGGGTQPGDPAVHVVRVIGHGVTVRRGEDDEELIEGSEALQEGAKGRNGLAVTRQQTQDVGVERKTPEPEARQQNEHQ